MTEGPAPTITIVGGGTAGWMTAAALARLAGHPWRVRLVESDAIGTVGVGEATIPQIQLFNQALGLDEDAFVRATGATYKLGIEFAGWGDADSRYLHAFGAVGRPLGLLAFHHYWLRARAAGMTDGLETFILTAAAARANRFARGGPVRVREAGPLAYAFHFDAGLYAVHLRRFAERLGVERHEGRIAHVERGGDGGVSAVLMDDGRRIDGDLFVDCSGFAGLLIGGALDTPYHDWTRWLPCDRALAVPSASTAPLLPYTRSTARAAGWQWRIPLQHRTGNGLVYCSAQMSDDEAAATLLAGLDGAALADPRPLKFTTGRREAAWAHNVVALGLSAGFLEPLESTSIHLIQAGIERLLRLLPRPGAGHAAEAAVFNRETAAEFEAVRDFIILHYHANRRPEPFWQACAAMAVPDTLREKLDLWAASARVVRRDAELFTEAGWSQVLIGQGVAAAGWHPLADRLPPAELRQFMGVVARTVADEAAALPDHAAFIARHNAMEKAA